MNFKNRALLSSVAATMSVGIGMMAAPMASLALEQGAEWDPNIQILVGETMVTAENANDVLGDGTVSYDVATNTLNLKDANITKGIDRGTTCGIIAINSINIAGNASISGVDIGILAISGDSTVNILNGADVNIDCDETGIDADRIFIENSKVAVNTDKTDDIALYGKAETVISNSVIDLSGSCCLEGNCTINNGSVVSVESSNVGLMGYDESLNIDNSKVTINAPVDIQYSVVNISGDSTVMDLTADHAAIVGGEATNISEGTVKINSTGYGIGSDNTVNIKNGADVNIASAEEGIKANRIFIENSNATVNSETTGLFAAEETVISNSQVNLSGSLCVEGNCTINNGSVVYAESSNGGMWGDTLNIDNSKVTINAPVDVQYNVVNVSGDNTVMDLTAEYKALVGGETVKITAGTINVNSTGYGIFGQSIDISGKNTKVSAKGALAAIVGETVNVSDVAVVTPEEGSVGTGVMTNDWGDEVDAMGVVDKNGAIATEVVFGHAHKLVKVEAVAPTTETEGNIEYYVCEDCGCYFKDEDGKEPISDKSSVVLPKVTVTPTPAPVAEPTTPSNNGDAQIRDLVDYFFRLIFRGFKLFW